jgi:alpha-tubulin suppressor-like RCC1 family protein
MKLLLVIGAAFVLSITLLLAAGGEPERAEAGTFTQVSSGASASCALVSSGGAVKCWGWNEFGQLGIGTESAPYEQSTLAIPVCASGTWNGTTCSGGSTFTSYGLSTGSAASHHCGLIVYLIVKCWGWNYYGQVGNGTSGDPVLNPVSVQCQGSSTYCASPNYILAGVGQVAAGDGHTCALDFGGYVWCWGRNQFGQLGDGTTTDRSYATRVCASGSGLDCSGGSLLSGAYGLSAGLGHTCVYTSSGAAQCWGNNNEGQLGDGSTTDSSLPVSVSGLTSGVTAMSGGERHTCAVVSGGAKCWGWNLVGQLGDDTTTDSTTPVSVCTTGSGSCGSLSNVSQISAGGGHTCALRTSSPYVVCWGWQYFGSLGNGIPVGSAESFENVERPMAWTVPSWGEPQPTSLSVGNGHACVLIASYA